MTCQVNVELLRQELCAAVRTGVRAGRMYEHHPGLVNRLVPPCDHEDGRQTLIVRAFTAEQIIRAAIAHIGGRTADALTVALGLHSDEIRFRTVNKRRREAARICGMQPTTWRQRYEATLIWDLSFQIIRIQLTRQPEEQAG